MAEPTDEQVRAVLEEFIMVPVLNDLRRERDEWKAKYEALKSHKPWIASKLGQSEW